MLTALLRTMPPKTCQVPHLTGLKGCSQVKEFAALSRAKPFANTPARWLKPRATWDEGRLRGLDEPAKAGFAPTEPGTSVPRRATLHQPCLSTRMAC